MRDQGNRAMRDQGNRAMRDQGNRAMRDQGNRAMRDRGNRAMRDRGNRATSAQGSKGPRERSNKRPKNGTTREQENGGMRSGSSGFGVQGLPAWHGVRVEFERMIGLVTTHPIIFTSRVESPVLETRDDKSLQNKIEKYTTSCQLANIIEPAKRGAKRVQIERAMLDFQTEHYQRAPDRISFSGTMTLSLLALALTPSLCDWEAHD